MAATKTTTGQKSLSVQAMLIVTNVANCSGPPNWPEIDDVCLSGWLAGQFGLQINSNLLTSLAQINTTTTLSGPRNTNRNTNRWRLSLPGLAGLAGRLKLSRPMARVQSRRLLASLLQIAGGAQIRQTFKRHPRVAGLQTTRQVSRLARSNLLAPLNSCYC